MGSVPDGFGDLPPGLPPGWAGGPTNGVGAGPTNDAGTPRPTGPLHRRHLFARRRGGGAFSADLRVRAYAARLCPSAGPLRRRSHRPSPVPGRGDRPRRRVSLPPADRSAVPGHLLCAGVVARQVRKRAPPDLEAPSSPRRRVDPGDRRTRAGGGRGGPDLLRAPHAGPGAAATHARLL